MSSNRKLLFGAVLVVAALVFWGLYSVISQRGAQATPTPVPVAQTNAAARSGRQIAFAATDIPQGVIVTKDMLEMRPLPGSGLTSGFITNLETQAVGFITKVPISRNTQIRPAEDFVGHISEVGVPGMLRPGTRAVVIPLANKPTLHDLVHIGNYVDINAAFDGQEARSIVQGVRVLAVDVFVNDFPSVNGAMRGGFKADPKGQGIASSSQPGAPGAVGGPGPTPTPTPAPAQAPARPDASLTLEVTPAQANTILLAQASGGTLDFALLPASVGNQSAAPTVDANGNPIAPTAEVLPVSVTKAQIAPYAERKKASGGGGPIRMASTNSGNGTTRPTHYRPEPLPTFIPPPNLGNGGTPGTILPPAQVPDTYNIPIYADGKQVRTETVLRPQN